MPQDFYTTTLTLWVIGEFGKKKIFNDTPLFLHYVLVQEKKGKEGEIK